jgi:hypothetical protein
VIDPWLDVYGRSQAEWAAAWWQWAVSIPVAMNPLFDAPGSDCTEGQVEDVFFLGGAFLGVDTATTTFATANRTCDVPANTPLFFPLINFMLTMLNAPPGASEADMLDAVGFFGEPMSNFVLEIDGVPQTGLSAHDQWPEAFDLFYPEGSLLESAVGPLPAGMTRGAEHGYYVMLEPLSAGTHTVRFAGRHARTAAVHGFDYQFDVDVTYTLNVPPSP